MFSKTSNHIQYIRACICIPKNYEDALYNVLSCVPGDEISFVDFKEALYEDGITENDVIMYNAFYRDTVLQLDTALPYEFPSQTVAEFIGYIKFCTGGKIFVIIWRKPESSEISSIEISSIPC